MKKIVITGGHLTPALALIEKLEKEKDYQIYFFGRKFALEGAKNLSAEYRQIVKKNIKFTNITTGRIQRKFTSHTIPSLLKIPLGFISSFLNLLLVRPNIILSFGGYLSTPVIFSGWLLGIDSITHEQALVAGLANKINSIFAKKIFVVWPQTIKFFPKEKTEVIGNLTRSAIFKKQAKDAKIQKFLNRPGKLIFITGGSLGSHFLNQKIFKLLPILDKYLVIHQVGTTNYRGDLDNARKIKRANYLGVDYLDADNIGAVLNRVDLTIARSGANTVWDLATLAKISILVPLPISASGEQQENAKILESAGTATILDQDQCTQDKLATVINYVFKHYSTFQKNAKNFAKTLPRDTVQKVAEYLK